MNGKQFKKRSADDMAEGEGSDNEDEDADEPAHKKFKVDRYVDRGWRLSFRFEKKKVLPTLFFRLSKSGEISQDFIKFVSDPFICVACVAVGCSCWWDDNLKK